jgi:hypothetical protein
MNPLKLFKKIYNLINILTPVAALLMFFCFCFSYDLENGYLIESPLTLIFYITYGACAVISLISILTQSEFEVISTPNGIHGRAKSYYTASNVASILIGALGFFMTHSPLIEKSILVASIGLISFGLFQLMLTSKSGYKFNIFKVIFLFVSIAMPVELVFGNNLDYNHHINSTINIFTVFFAVSFLLYILTEAKRICNGVHTHWHLPTMLLTFATGMVVSGAYLFAFLFDIIKDGSYFYQMLMIMAVSAFIAIELKHFMYVAKTKSITEWTEEQNRKSSPHPSEEETTNTPNNP